MKKVKRIKHRVIGMLDFHRRRKVNRHKSKKTYNRKNKTDETFD